MKENKYIKLFWFIVLIMPLIYWLGIIALQLNNVDTLSYSTIADLVADSGYLVVNRLFTGMGFLSNKIRNITTIITGYTAYQDNYILMFGVTMFSWFVYVEIMKVVVNVFVLLPKICNKLIRKVVD